MFYNSIKGINRLRNKILKDRINIIVKGIGKDIIVS